MLDEQDGQVEVVADAADEPRQLLDLLVAEPACRLVQQEQTRPRGESARDLDALLQTVRKLPRLCLRRIREAHVLERLPRPLRPAAHHVAAVRSDDDVLLDRHGREELDVLERPRDAAVDDAVRRRPQQRFPSKTRSPDCGLYSRVITLKSVVLPAPFGPISPTISPGSASIETSSSATIPPNSRVTCSTVSKGATREP